MVVKIKFNSVNSLVFFTILCFFSSLSVESADSVLKPKIEVELVNLSKLGLVESNYWLPIQSTISQPDKPRLSAEKLGLDFTFCVSIDFTIDRNGYVSQWNVVGMYPRGFEKEILRGYFNNLLDWRFEPSSKNIKRYEVISNRIFIFNPKKGREKKECFNL